MTIPSDYNLSHHAWRPYQEQSVDWCSGIGDVGILEAPTGSGKTALAKAISTHRSVIALCRTKNLQAENYGKIYGAAVLFGRGNYPCVHPDADYNTTCAECLYQDTSMHRCQYAGRCPYLQAKMEAQASPFLALNYAYYLTAKWPRENGAQVLFLDEGHQLSEITLGFAGCTVTHKAQVEWGLPAFPEIAGTGMIQLSNPVDAAIEWLGQARSILRDTYSGLKRLDLRNREALVKCENLGRKIGATLNALHSSPDDWYIRSGQRAQRYSGHFRPAFVAKPLTARHHFSHYFLDGHAAIAMSATIGDEMAFCGELGIGPHEFRVVPNQWPPEMRKAYVLNTPKLGMKSKAGDYERQANAIAKAILGCPKDWSGIIHVTRKSEAKILADRLARRGLQDRMWMMPGWDGTYSPTDDQVDAWNERRRRIPNSICVTWALWEGYNGLDERINIAAKCPFPYLGDEYENERMHYSGSFYLQRTAYQLEQALGRTRRGRAEDYGDENGFVAIADGNWVRVRKYLSQSLREAIVEG